jgi:Flp pilus assembly protein TadD
VNVVAQILRTIALTAAVAFAGVSVSDAQDRDGAKAQVEFGISVAQRGLWQEALYRWERASQLDPGYAAAWNNLGIAYEHVGVFDKAREAYEKALDLDPDNINIQQNYDLFREINDRIQSSR